MDFSIASILLLDGVTNGAIYALLGLATVLVFTVTRIIFIPQGEFVAYDEKGRVQTFGIFKDDKKEGEWLLKRGKKKIFYVNDIEQKKVSGKIKTN